MYGKVDGNMFQSLTIIVVVLHDIELTKLDVTLFAVLYQ
jgi:hypothetical protein